MYSQKDGKYNKIVKKLNRFNVPNIEKSLTYLFKTLDSQIDSICRSSSFGFLNVQYSLYNVLKLTIL